ncbi:MAG: hypothetical protein HW387_145 [Parachlamydiales bacterium]|nr:hypothetical protein [Parachlamydiales bacterium]
MKDDKFENYIFDLGKLIKEKALEAKRIKESSSNDDKYNIGYLMAFHEVIDIMKQQAVAFKIKQKDVGLDDMDPDSELL